jgi:hypothetical protein
MGIDAEMSKAISIASKRQSCLVVIRMLYQREYHWNRMFHQPFAPERRAPQLSVSQFIRADLRGT